MNILAKAEKLVTGARRESYGDVVESFDQIAASWSIILRTEVKAEDVAMCMISLKMCREAHSHKADNLVDIAGYAYLLNACAEARAKK